MTIESEILEIRRDLDNLKRGGLVASTVTAFDNVNKNATVQIVQPDGTTQTMKFPVAGSFLPEAGSQAVVYVNGLTPLILPIGGKTVAEDGSWLRSPNYVTGVSGWKIDADGSAEFNNVVVRGTLSAGVIDTATSVAMYVGSSTFSLFNDIANGGFETNVTGWTGTNCTPSRVTTPVDVGTGAMALTVTGTGAFSVITATGTSGADISQYPGNQWQVSARIRTASIVRGVTLQALFYNAAGTLLTTWNGGSEGMTAAVNDSTSYTTYTARSTAPPSAKYAAVKISFNGGQSSEIHYVDVVTLGGPAIGFCPDVDPLGTYTQLEGISATYTLPPGYAGYEGSGAGNQGIAGGYPNYGAVASISPNLGYTVNALMTCYTGGGTVRAEVRAYAAWYTSAGVPIRVDKGKPFYVDSGIAVTVAGNFVSPSNAAYVFAGVCGEPGLTATGTAISGVSVNLYQTSIIRSGAAYPEVGFWNGGGVPTGTAINPPMPGNILLSGGLAIRDEPIPGYVVGDGRAVSRTKYADLFSLYGTTFGAGDGSTTFNLPKLHMVLNNVVYKNKTNSGVTSGAAASWSDWGYGNVNSANTGMQVTHVKQYASTDLKVTCHATYYTTVQVNQTGLAIYMDNATRTGLMDLFFNEVTSHKSHGGFVYLTGVSAGSHTFKPQVGTNGTQIYALDANDSCVLEVAEVDNTNWQLIKT